RITGKNTVSFAHVPPDAGRNRLKSAAGDSLDGTGATVDGDPPRSSRGVVRARGGVVNPGPVKAPWEGHGRKWHVHEHVGTNGRAKLWDGRILERIVDEIDSFAASDPAVRAGFAPAEWSERNVVRILGTHKTRANSPFFHAMTSSEWVVTLRFFV